MRRRLTSILIVFLLAGLAAAGHTGLLSWPFNILVSLDISVPDALQSFGTAKKDEPSSSIKKNLGQSASDPHLALSTAVEQRPKATEPNSAVIASKPGQGATLTIARISSDGPSVFGGTAAPFAPVTVLDGATPVATATANANGDWSLVTEYKFANTDPKIGLQVGDTSEKSKSVAAQVPDSAVPSTAAAVSDQTPPAVQLLKKFEGVVAAAREEAKQGATPSPANKGPADVSASIVPPVQTALDKPANVSPSISSGPSLTTTTVPMTFVYNEASLTPEGRGAVRLLLEYLTLKKFGSVTLSGHADERGLPIYNMELSRQRLVTIEHFLRDGGYEGKLDLLPKGATEPFMGVDRSKFPYEQLMQLDRRVELRVAN
jgi:outer membrane protein OmpA-like peptidoglycan-associated protein